MPRNTPAAAALASQRGLPRDRRYRLRVPVDVGKAGGEAVLAKYGRAHFAALARKANAAKVGKRYTELQVCTNRLHREDVARLDLIAARLGIPRSELVRKIVEGWLDA